MTIKQKTLKSIKSEYCAIYSYFKLLEFLSRYSFSRYSVTRYSLLRYSV